MREVNIPGHSAEVNACTKANPGNVNFPGVYVNRSLERRLTCLVSCDRKERQC